MMLDWLIIGGGFHGTYLSHFLVNAGVPRDRLQVLDPFAEPLARWNHLTHNTGMQYMRSPRYHHLDIADNALESFIHKRGLESDDTYIPPYKRPRYDLFQLHTATVLQQHRLADLRIQGTATKLSPQNGGWGIETTNGQLFANKVMLAIGRPVLNIPEWKEMLADEGVRVHHILDMDFDRQALHMWDEAVVVGGGITGGQIALTLAEQQPGSVTLLMRQSVQESDFDSSPCWVSPACLKPFYRANYQRRRWMIGEARKPGTMSTDIAKQVRQAVQAGKLKLVVGEIANISATDERAHFQLEAGERVVADLVILATGFESKRPGGGLIDELIATLKLRIGDCGYPITDRALGWYDNLYVTGPLAELENGPAAANFAGARMTARKIRTRI